MRYGDHHGYIPVVIHDAVEYMRYGDHHGYIPVVIHDSVESMAITMATYLL